MGALKVWNGTAWAVASQQGPAGPPGAAGISSLSRAIHAAGGVNVSSGSPLVAAITTFTMPFLGTILLNGIAQFVPGSVTTPVSALMDVSPTAVPPASTTLQWIGPQMIANVYYAAIPFSYKWVNVPAGAAVQLTLKYSTNSAVQLVLNHVAADVRIVTAEF